MIRLFLLTTSIFALQLCIAQKGSLSGTVFDIKKSIPVSHAFVLLKATNKYTNTDDNGYFKFDSIIARTYILEVKQLGYAPGELLVKVSKDSLINVHIELPVPCKYDSSKNNKTCPICKKKNMVIPILYGLPVGEMNEDEYYYAGCEVTYCDPNWYCKRDKHTF